MNPFSIIVLCALVGEWLLDRLASRLSSARMGAAPPTEVAAAYPPEVWERTRAYVRARSSFGLWPATAELIGLLAFWQLGGFAWLEVQVAALDLGPLLHGMAYIGALVLLRSLLALPFEYHSTFGIEERFGFNRMTRGTFWADRLKGLVLGGLLGGGLLALVLQLFLEFGPGAWLWVWLAISAFSLAMQVVVPIWVLPLFFRFEPLQDGSLRERLLQYAGRVEFPLQDVYLIDGSRRSTKANAFFTGFGRARRVALFDTLLERHSEEEVVAVLAHEIGHYKRRHIWRSTLLGLLHTGVLLFVFSRFLESEGLHAAFALEAPAVHTALVLFGLLYTPIELALSLGFNALSRKHEFEADAFAAETLEDGGRHLAAALVHLSSDALSNPAPHPLSVWLHASHPPVPARVRALQG